MKPTITFDEFAKMDLRIGKIIDCVRKEKSEKLLRLTVDFGEEGTRNILTGLSAYYKPSQLKNKTFLFIINLEPRKLMGEESQGMFLCAEGEKPIPLKPVSPASPGSNIL